MGIGRQFQDIVTEPKPSAKPAAARPVPTPAPQPIAKQIVKRGRPRIEDKGKTLSDLKPWVALGMCRRTWENRRKETRKN